MAMKSTTHVSHLPFVCFCITMKQHFKFETDKYIRKLSNIVQGFTANILEEELTAVSQYTTYICI